VARRKALRLTEQSGGYVVGARAALPEDWEPRWIVDAHAVISNPRVVVASSYGRAVDAPLACFYRNPQSCFSLTYVITDACIGVKGEACIAVCPEQCVFSETVDHMSFIDPARCTDCGVCDAACVVGAIFPANRLSPMSLEFEALNAAWFHHRHGVRQRVKEIAQELNVWLPNEPLEPAT